LLFEPVNASEDLSSSRQGARGAHAFSLEKSRVVVALGALSV
jgi:hypothetical protein